MVDRIRQLLQARQLSPTQFADTIGVARPIISHILGGRNKPSLEVVQKIITAFPDVSMPWLLTGQGAMVASEASVVASPAASAPPVAPAPPMAPKPARRTRSATAEATAAATQAAVELEAATAAPVRPPVVPPAPTPASEAVPTPGAAPAPVGLGPLAGLVPVPQPAKTIRRVLIFYSDGTFTDFSPSESIL